jgi:hypothetical protein
MVLLLLQVLRFLCWALQTARAASSPTVSKHSNKYNTTAAAMTAAAAAAGAAHCDAGQR